ncbi:MAG: phosphotransferase [Methylococcaceae bacterium]
MKSQKLNISSPELQVVSANKKRLLMGIAVETNKHNIFDDKYSVTISTKLNFFPITLDLYDISRESISVRLEKEQIKLLSDTDSFEHTKLIIDGEDQGELRFDSFEIEEGENKTLIGRFRVNSCSSRAVLWKAIHYHHSVDHIAKNKYQQEGKLSSVPGRGLYTEKARKTRLDFVRDHTRCKLKNVENTSFDPQQLTSNIEAFLGSVEVPVGVAGPLIVNGQSASGKFYVPMATTEGALISSVTRGAYAISLAGGVVTHVIGQRMQRVPMFVFDDVSQAMLFALWISDHFEEVKAETAKYSNYAELIELEADVHGNVAHVHFVYATGDAAGQNMTTTCTWHASLWVIKQMKFFSEINIQNFTIEGGLSSDKKVSYKSFIRGRGIKVTAECVVPARVITRVLKTTPEQLKAIWDQYTICAIGAGMVGINVNVANVIAAMFTATGQDIACVHESSLANTSIDVTENGDLYANMVLPGIVAGTVGGGTNLPQQRECLEMLGCAGPGNASKLAEIIAGCSLALDLSTLAAVAAGHFAKAHERLGRNRKVNHLKLGEFDTEFFDVYLRKSIGDPTIQTQSVEIIESYEMEGSIITELTSRKLKKTIGLFPFHITYQDEVGKNKLKLMVKIKPTSEEVCDAGAQIAGMCDSRLASEFEKHKNEVSTYQCDERELAMYRQDNPLFLRNMPRIYGIYEDSQREAYVVVQELLENMTLMDSANDVSGWKEEHIKAAIKGIAECHSVYYGKEDEVKQQPWIGNYPTAKRRQSLTRLYELLGAHALEEFPEWVSQDYMDNFRTVLYSVGQWWPVIESMSRTLIHNDFSPRNVAFRNVDGDLHLCAYDWELATLHLPQFDLAEMLAFTLAHGVSAKTVKELVEYHRKCLEQLTGEEIDPSQWWQGFRFAVWDFVLSKLSLYLMLHTFRHYEFMERVFSSVQSLFEIVGTDIQQIDLPEVSSVALG